MFPQKPKQGTWQGTFLFSSLTIIALRFVSTSTHVNPQRWQFKNLQCWNVFIFLFIKSLVLLLSILYDWDDLRWRLRSCANIPSPVIFLHILNMVNAGEQTGGPSQGRTSPSVRVHDELHYLSLLCHTTSEILLLYLHIIISYKSSI